MNKINKHDDEIELDMTFSGLVDLFSDENIKIFNERKKGKKENGLEQKTEYHRKPNMLKIEEEKEKYFEKEKVRLKKVIDFEEEIDDLDWTRTGLPYYATVSRNKKYYQKNGIVYDLVYKKRLSFLKSFYVLFFCRWYIACPFCFSLLTERHKVRDLGTPFPHFEYITEEKSLNTHIPFGRQIWECPNCEYRKIFERDGTDYGPQ